MRILKFLAVFPLLFFFFTQEISARSPAEQFIVVLGVAQDAGFPHVGCEKEHCAGAFRDARGRERVVSLGIVDRAAKKKFLIEATPDITEQLFDLNRYLPSAAMLPDGVFMTHAHIGHYTGLMYFGREAIGAKGVTVYAMPRMDGFLRGNAPWSQLVGLGNIELRRIEAGRELVLSEGLRITPFLVPHRDEYTETVGYEIKGKRKSAIFIPDIDKWSKWDQNLADYIKRVDYALVDATFYKNGEIPNRDMSEIPHPFAEETMKLLGELPASEKAKVIFIHFNHTNPLILKGSPESREVKEQGFRVAEQGLVLEL